jgi:glycosyltransferase involved in cell wall biosynthesis
MKKKGDKNLVSILITNYNKGSFIKKTIESCLSQNYKNKEILLFDDCSVDNSLDIINKYKKNVRLVSNKNKQFKSAPLNQINGIIRLFKKSRGSIIFLLDGDDQFKKNKLKYIFNLFEKRENLNFIQDKPYLTKNKELMYLKKKNYTFSIWPSFYPTSCTSIKRKYFLKFLKFIHKNEFPNLEIDARLAIFAHLDKNFFKINKNLTIYNHDEYGITSKYTKYSKNWWIKRKEAFDYLLKISKKRRIKTLTGPDYYLTKFINFFI